MGATSGQHGIAVAALVLLSALAAPVAAAPDRGAIQAAIRGLEADHDRAVAASRILRAGGRPAAEAIRDAWPSLSVLARKRSIEPLTGLAVAHEAAVQALVAAARSDDEQLQNAGLAALQRAAPGGREGLAALLMDPRVGDRASLLLARTDPSFALGALLKAIASDDGSDRAALRQALAVAAERGGDTGAALDAWLRSNPQADAVASAALGLSTLDAERIQVARLIEQAIPDARGFATQWRLVQSAGPAGQSERIDAWLGAERSEPQEWMLRDAAVEALAMRGHREQARSSLGDPYPRVRARTATVLAGDAATMVARAELARRDAWPMVRAAAVTSLRREGQAAPVVVAAVDDSMSLVRAAAIEALASAPHEEGWERIHRRLRDSNEWPNVTAAAIDYAAAHCRTDAVDALLRVVLRAAPSNARTEDLNNAAHAIEALRILGTPESQAAVEQLRRTQDVPPTLKMALQRPLSEDGGCGQAGR
ncbi:MAG: hypothetical protein AMJ62_13710 [Myxococcales bacterium SG8_38]|nr:MAG: hypothetical protein AMJ62_13710 [Myxococcales bacterium SG8_38]